MPWLMSSSPMSPGTQEPWDPEAQTPICSLLLLHIKPAIDEAMPTLLPWLTPARGLGGSLTGPRGSDSLFLTCQHLLHSPCCISLPASGCTVPQQGAHSRARAFEQGAPSVCSRYIPSSQTILNVCKPQELQGSIP